MADLPEPLAQGDLARTPFAHVLLHCQSKEHTGSLVLWRTDVSSGQPRQDRVLFEAGIPVAAALTERASSLERGLLPLFARPRGPYAFYAGVDLVGEGDRVRRGRVNVLELLAASLRGSCRDDVAADVVRRFGDSMLRLHRGVDLDAFGLLADERNTIDLLRAKPMPAAELRELSPLEPRMVLRLLYLLAITHSVEPWDGQVSRPPRRTPSKSGRNDASDSGSRRRHTAPEPPPAPPDGLSPEHRARWEEIAERVVGVESETYFRMLGVGEDASADAVQTAYFKAVKRWHPDRLPEELAPLRSHVERVFRYLTRASETLSDPEARGQYLAAVKEGGGTPEKERELAAIVDAAMEFRKVEVLLRRRAWDEALELIDDILAVAPDEADYHATRGYVLFQHSTGDEARRGEVLASLDAALDLVPDHDKAHYYRGVALKRWGELDAALSHFRKAAELNPRNLEAAREVRLAEMRAGKGGAKRSSRRAGKRGKSGRSRTSDKEGESFFDKLFGGKKK